MVNIVLFGFFIVQGTYGVHPAWAGAKIVSGDGYDAGSDMARRFLLTDHNGQSVSNETFFGSYLIVYFGYTHCPDICPTSLQTFTEVLENLGDDADKIQVAFITVDTERDTPERMKEYVEHFDPRIVGLTGSETHIRAAASAYKIRYDKIMTEETDYEVDHSSSAIFMGPNGRFLTRWGYGTSVDAITKDIGMFLQK